MKKYLLPIICLCIISSCRHSDQWEVLCDIDSFIDERPDSALVVVDSIDVTRLVGDEEQAKYSLLKSIALDKNYIDLKSDSIISVALDYYGKRKLSKEKMLAYYYDGVILFNKKEYHESIISLYTAEQYARQLDDKKYLGIILLTEAHIYTAFNIGPKELDCATEAHNIFAELGIKKYYLQSLYRLATAYQNNRLYDKADSLYSDSYNPIMAFGDTSMMKNYLMPYATCLVIQPDKDPDKSIELFTKVVRDLRRPMDIRHVSIFAYAYQLAGKPDMADKLLKKVESSPDSYYWQFRIYKLRGDIHKAYDYLRYSATHQDTTVNNILNNSILQTLDDYHALQSRTIKEENDDLKLLIVIIALSVLIIIIVAYMIIKNKIRKFDNDALLMKEIADRQMKNFENDLNKTQNSISDLRAYIKTNKKSQFAILRTLCEELTLIESRSEETSFIKNRIFPILTSIISDRGANSEFEKLINDYTDDSMKKLRKEMKGKMREDDFVIICYFIAGFDSSLISRLMGKNIGKEDIYSRKHRIKKRLKESNINIVAINETFFDESEQ